MHIGVSHYKLTIWYHIISTKYIAQIRFELCVNLYSNYNSESLPRPGTTHVKQVSIPNVCCKFFALQGFFVFI